MLEAAERCERFVRRAVDGHATGVELVRNPPRPGDIGREHIAREPVVCVIGDLDRIDFIAIGDDAQHAAAFGGDREAMLALVAEDIEWIIPGKDWPLTGTHRGHAGLTDLLKTESETIEMSLSEPREFVAQEDRVLVVGFARGKVKATNKPFEDDWIFAITVRDGKLPSIRE